jgi:hypothetical protein
MKKIARQRKEMHTTQQKPLPTILLAPTYTHAITSTRSKGISEEHEEFVRRKNLPLFCVTFSFYSGNTKHAVAVAPSHDLNRAHGDPRNQDNDDGVLRNRR